MKLTLIAFLIAALAAGFLAYRNYGGREASINKITSVSPSEQKEAAFEASQTISSDTSVAAIEADLNSTVILDEDFSDLE